MYQKALQFRKENTIRVNTWDEFKEVIASKGGFVSAHWDGTPETEEKIKDETKATIRCIPLDNEPEEGKCIYSGKPSKQTGIVRSGLLEFVLRFCGSAVVQSCSQQRQPLLVFIF